MTSMNCLIADDEPLARKGMENFVAKIPFLRVLATCSNPLQVGKMLQEHHIDLLFLDVHMPGMSGIEFLQVFPDAPLTIITTAFPHYALEGYELNVVDYLVKPIPFERFVKAVHKARDLWQMKQLAVEGKAVGKGDEFFFVKCENRYEKIIYSELLFVRALQNYVVLQTEHKKLISHLTFKSLCEHLPHPVFLKVHKSSIVSVAKIDAVEGNEIKIQGHSIAIGRQYKQDILEGLVHRTLVKR